MGKPTPEQLARINQLAREPLAEDQVYTFQSKVIGDKLIPKYNLKLSANFLQKMAAQAKDGIALLVDHPWTKLDAKAIPYGRTFNSKLQSDGDELALYADHYMVLGLEFDGIKTNDLAAGIDAGTIFDTSAGFLTYKHLCSICNQNYYRSDCMHISGQTYDGKMCYKIGDDGDLMENSLVFDGGYEGAGVVNLNKSGSKNDQKIEWIPLDPTAKSLPDDSRIFYAFSARTGITAYVQKSEINQEEVGSMNELEQAKQQLSAVQSVLSSVREKLKVSTDTDIAGALAVLSAKAQLGEQYSAKVVDEACGAGVRALGEAFNVDAMKLAFSNLPVSEVEKIRDTYEAQAQVALGGGGRKTQPEHHDLPDGKPSNPQGEVNLSAAEKQEKAREEARLALSKHGYKHMLKDGE